MKTIKVPTRVYEELELFDNPKDIADEIKNIGLRYAKHVDPACCEEMQEGLPLLESV